MQKLFLMNVHKKEMPIFLEKESIS